MADCCTTHTPGAHHGTALCCDPNDCGPCCRRCPTCPSLAATRQAERDTLVALTGAGVAPFVQSQVALRSRVTELEQTLAEVLDGHWKRGHPGRPAVQSAWVNTETFDRWRAVLNREGVADGS